MASECKEMAACRDRGMTPLRKIQNVRKTQWLNQSNQFHITSIKKNQGKPLRQQGLSQVEVNQCFYGTFNVGGKDLTNADTSENLNPECRLTVKSQGNARPLNWLKTRLQPNAKLTRPMASVTLSLTQSRGALVFLQKGTQPHLGRSTLDVLSPRPNFSHHPWF